MIGTLLIRADGSTTTGTGHVMRCFALAQAWQDAGGDVVFALAQYTPAIVERLRAEKILDVLLETTVGSLEDARATFAVAKQHAVQWIVVDGYQFNTRYQHEIREAGFKLLIIDDVNYASHYHADLLLNHNPHAFDNCYLQREAYTRLLLGPRFALLRREFTRLHGWQREISKAGGKVLVTMGGSDPDNVTADVLHALSRMADSKFDVAVVIGGSNPHFAKLEKIASRFPGKIQLYRAATDMPALMSWADVAISAGGGTCLELCRLGLPAILIDIAPNQTPGCQTLHQLRCAIHFSSSQCIEHAKLAETVGTLLGSPETRSEISRHARALVDGKGAKRVISAIKIAGMRLRRAEQRDCRLLWEWANDPVVRAMSFSPHAISWDEHQRWFQAKMKAKDSLILIGEDEQGIGVGQFRIDLASDHEGVIDISIADKFRGAGYSVHLLEMAARRVFETTAARRMHAYVRIDNPASIRAFESAGFVGAGEDRMKEHSVFHYVLSRNQI